MWDVASIRGLNAAVQDGREVFLRCRDTATGITTDAFGFDVGQPLASPPIHPNHRNLGLGEVCRILAFPSRQQCAFMFRVDDHDYSLEIDGRGPLVMTLHGPRLPHLRHTIVFGRDEIPLMPGHSVEISDTTRTYPAVAPPPAARLSPEEALRQVVHGNTVRSPSGGLYLPVNRAWVTMIGHMFHMPADFAGPMTFIWDSAFNAILASRVDPRLAMENLRLLVEQCEPDGFFRQLRVGDRVNNLTNLPVVSHAVMEVFEASRDLDFVAELYPRLVAWNRWLRKNRDKNQDGLLEWGWEPAGRGIELFGRYAPHYESGLDDSPMWQEESVDEPLRAMTTSAVCLSSITAWDCLVLARLAELSKRPDDALELRAAHARLKDRINAELWDDSRQVYANRRWTGELSRVLSPTSFFPLLAEIPDMKRAQALIRLLDDPRAFGGEFRLPSIARSSEHFTADGDYWRGRVWPPLNYLVLQGLKKYDERAAMRLADDNRRLFMHEWLAHGHIHENYCADTGWGEGPAGVYYRSCPFYTWGGLLLLQ
jgi:putative isomerase